MIGAGRSRAVIGLLLAGQAFLLLATYYLLKTAREPTVLAYGGAEVRSYLAGAQAFLLVAAVHGYAWLAGRFDRARLIVATSIVFALGLIALYAASSVAAEVDPRDAISTASSRGWASGTAASLYLWVGLFGVTAMTQVWSLASDVLSNGESTRWIPRIGAGAALGGVVGAFGAGPLVSAVGMRSSLLCALVPLGGYVALALAVHRRDRRAPRASEAVETRSPADAVRAVLDDRYLLMLAALALLMSWVNTNGEYVLAQTVLEAARAMTPSGDIAAVERAIAHFYSGFFGWVNVLALLLSLFAVGPALRRFGVGAALVVVPICALAGYGAMAFVPVLALVKVAKVVENASDYSLSTCARQMLLLPTSREARYTSRATIDTLMVRSGDVLSALLVCTGSAIGLAPRHFAIVNVLLAGTWLALVVSVSRRHAERERLADAE